MTTSQVYTDAQCVDNLMFSGILTVDTSLSVDMSKYSLDLFVLAGHSQEDNRQNRKVWENKQGQTSASEFSVNIASVTNNTNSLVTWEKKSGKRNEGNQTSASGFSVNIASLTTLIFQLQSEKREKKRKIK